MADPHNHAALRAVAALFQARCSFYDRRGSPESSATGRDVEIPRAPGLAAIRREYDLIIALETGPLARNRFTYRLPPGRRVALFVGNERRGVGADVHRVADVLLHITMRAGGGQSLNVAGAAAAALAQLTYRPPAWRPCPRPDVLFVQPTDPAELGSSLRTAWALGWGQVRLLDSAAVWFTRDRAAYVQGRGAARRHKNALRVLPWQAGAAPLYDQGVVITLSGTGPPLWSVHLPRGASTVVFFPDEGAAPVAPEIYAQAARTVQWVTLGLPAAAPYHYRLSTAIGLTELARRSGGPTRGG